MLRNIVVEKVIFFVVQFDKQFHVSFRTRHVGTFSVIERGIHERKIFYAAIDKCN